MSFETVAGSKLWVATTLPGTQTAGAFAALTWVAVGEITDMPSVLGREYNTSNHAPVGTSQQVEKKASYKLPNAEFMCAWDEADAGQIILAARALTNDVISFRVDKQSGAKRYFTAQVAKFVENMGTVDNVVQGACTLLRQTDTVTA